MRKIALILTFLLSSLLMTTSVVATPDVALNLDHQVYLPLIAKHDPEWDALMALYHSTNGPGWTTNTGWGTDVTHTVIGTACIAILVMFRASTWAATN